MEVKECLEKIRKLDARIAEAEAAMRRAERQRAEVEAKLSEAFMETGAADKKLLTAAGEAAVEARVREDVLARLRQEREVLLDELIETRARQLEEQAAALEAEIREREGKAYDLLQKAGRALGYEEPVPLMLLYYRGLVLEDPRATEGCLTKEWPTRNPRTVELAREAQRLRERARVIVSHPGHRQEELNLLFLAS
jgi:hypothetical protein